MFSDWNGKAAMAAMTTPFTAQGRVNKEQLSSHAHTMLKRGLQGVVPFGTTGEGASLGWEEKATVLEHLLAAGIPPARIVMGIAASSVEEAAQAGKHALSLKCRGLLLAPPFYFKDPGEEGLFRWFSEVISRMGAEARGVILYHIPSVTGVALSPELVIRLRSTFGEVVAGVKDSSGNLENTRDFMRLTGLPVLVGHEGLLAGMMSEGAAGSISGLANLLPERIDHMVNRGKNDSLFVPLVRLVLGYPVVPAVKTLLAHVLGDPTWLPCRVPLEAMSRENSAQLTQAYDLLCQTHVA